MSYADPALISSAAVVYITPPDHLALVCEVGRTDRIDFDPCTEANNPTNAVMYYSRGTLDLSGCVRLGSCGLRGAWPRHPGATIHVNPPYGKHLAGPVEPDADVIVRKKGVIVYQGKGTGWASKCATQAITCPDQHMMVLLPGRTETQWYRTLARVMKAKCEHEGRYHFSGMKNSAPFPVHTLYFGPDWERFRDVFRGEGEIVRRAP